METRKSVSGEGGVPLPNQALDLFACRAERQASRESKIVPMDMLPGISYTITNRKVVPVIQMDNSLPSCLMPPPSRGRVKSIAEKGKMYDFGKPRS